MDRPEISVKDVAELYVQKGKSIMRYSGTVKFCMPKEKDYLANNPSRRCPNIDKARKILGYNPLIEVDEGISKYLNFLKFNEGKL